MNVCVSSTTESAPGPTQADDATAIESEEDGDELSEYVDAYKKKPDHGKKWHRP